MTLTRVRALVGPRSNTRATDTASWLLAVAILAVVIPASEKIAANDVFFAAHGVSPLAWVVLLVAGLVVCWLVLAGVVRLLKAVLPPLAFDVVTSVLMVVISWFFVGNVLARTLLSSAPGLAAVGGLVVAVLITLAARRLAMGNVLMVFATVAAVFPLVTSIWSGSQTAPAQAFGFDEAAQRPDVVWIISDELQYPLAFDAEGNVRPELPNLKALQQDSTTYTKAYSGANYTDYAVPSMLSGISDVAAQGAERMQAVRAGIGIVPGLANEYSVVMESPIYGYECKDAACASVGSDSEAGAFGRYLGFAKDTAAIAGKTALASPFSDAFPSLDGKWKDFWSGGDEFGDEAEGNSVGAVIAGLGEALSANPGAPVFALWHSIRTHAPWSVDREGRQIFPGRVPVVEGAHMVGSKADQTYTTDELKSLERRLYADSAVDFDRQLGLLVDELKASGRYDSTMIVVTADHGAGITEQADRRMGDTLEQRWTEVAHVPLLVKAPGQAEPDVVDAPRSTGQIAASVLAATGATAGPDTVLSPDLSQDLPAGPVFTTVVGGVMTPWVYSGAAEPDPWLADDLTPPRADYPYAIGIDEALLGAPIPIWIRATCRRGRHRPAGRVLAAAPGGDARPRVVRSGRRRRARDLGGHRHRVGPVGAHRVVRVAGQPRLGHRPEVGPDHLPGLVRRRLTRAAPWPHGQGIPLVDAGLDRSRDRRRGRSRDDRQGGCRPRVARPHRRP